MDHIGKFILNSSHRLKRVLTSNLSDSELSSIGMRIIHFLSDREKNDVPVYQRDIENEFNIRRSSVTSVLGNLEKMGLISRSAVEGDARLKKVTLTKKAMDMQRRNDRYIVHVEKVLLTGITEEEYGLFESVMNKISSNISILEEENNR